MVQCKDCRHFRDYPHRETTWKRKTGCYHPDHMEQKQDDMFLKEQEVPGNHREINRLEDCSDFEVRAEEPSWFERLIRTLAS